MSHSACAPPRNHLSLSQILHSLVSTRSRGISAFAILADEKERGQIALQITVNRSRHHAVDKAADDFLGFGLRDRAFERGCQCFDILCIALREAWM